jgi:hypothetical protein
MARCPCRLLSLRSLKSFRTMVILQDSVCGKRRSRKSISKTTMRSMADPPRGDNGSICRGGAFGLRGKRNRLPALLPLPSAILTCNKRVNARGLQFLWDIRVHPNRTSRGIGTLLFDEASRFARSMDCSRLEVETQNVNVAACRFYQKMGCKLCRVDRFAYPQQPEEVQLIWQKVLAPG